MVKIWGLSRNHTGPLLANAALVAGAMYVQHKQAVLASGAIMSMGDWNDDRPVAMSGIAAYSRGNQSVIVHQGVWIKCQYCGNSFLAKETKKCPSCGGPNG